MDAVRSNVHSSAASTGVWVGVATISMSFAAYTSALVVRQGASADWLHFRLPTILFVNTFLLLASSVTLEAGRRIPFRTARWLDATLALGALFVVGQVIAWRQLASQGLFLSTNPSSAFFYILTALHALHVLGGLGGLVYVRYRVRQGTAVSAAPALAAGSLYWHFMAVLWVYLLALLIVRL